MYQFNIVRWLYYALNVNFYNCTVIELADSSEVPFTFYFMFAIVAKMQQDQQDVTGNV